MLEFFLTICYTDIVPRGEQYKMGFNSNEWRVYDSQPGSKEMGYYST